MRPLIGIAPGLTASSKKEELIKVPYAYVAALERTSATCVILNPSIHLVETYCHLLDGLMLIGGRDIHPHFFGQKPLARIVQTSPEKRTRFELALVQLFVKTQKPILGICLGCQTLNVALGGTLIQDLASECPTAREHQRGHHAITTMPHSKLRRILGQPGRRMVNSRHHQATAAVGKGLKVCAIACDNVIEAIEMDNHPFAIGVQWHPESQPHSSTTEIIFRSFVRHCKQAAQ